MVIEMIFFRLLWLMPIVLISNIATAVTIATDEPNDKRLVAELLESPANFISSRIRENYNFNSLASYYGNIKYYIVENEKVDNLEEGEVIELKKNQWLAVVGRFNVLLIRAKDLSVYLDDSGLVLKDHENLTQKDIVIKIVKKSQLLSISPELDQIRYFHLWSPLAALARLSESTLIILHNYVGTWGVTLVVFSVLLKFLLLPVSIATVRLQRRMSQVQSQLAPMLADIKANYDGEEAHNRLMSAHKELGVTPFYTLKPMLGSFIQIPVLIAVFNALGEMPQLDGQAFLWIDNLAYPDVIGYIPFVIPMFGDIVSLLPFVMTAITLFSTMTFQNHHASESEVKRQKRNLYLMSAAFFILFYPFPAAMVFYWAMNNLLHIFQQQVIKI